MKCRENDAKSLSIYPLLIHSLNINGASHHLLRSFC